MDTLATGIRDIKRTEYVFDGIAHPFRRSPADRKTLRDVVEGQSFGSPLEADRQAHNVRHSFVAHDSFPVNVID